MFILALRILDIFINSSDDIRSLSLSQLNKYFCSDHLLLIVSVDPVPEESHARINASIIGISAVLFTVKGFLKNDFLIIKQI